MAYTPEGAIKHIVHDYVYLVIAGTDTQKGLRGPSNHYAERTFLVHCRALAKFFSAESDCRDVYAREFTRKPFVRTLPLWEKWREHIDKHLMHLTKARVDNTVPWTGEPNKCLLEEFKAVWAEFMKDLKNEFKPLFLDALKGHQEAYRTYPLS